LVTKGLDFLLELGIVGRVGLGVGVGKGVEGIMAVHIGFVVPLGLFELGIDFLLFGFELGEGFFVLLDLGVQGGLGLSEFPNKDGTFFHSLEGLGLGGLGWVFGAVGR